MARQQDSKKNKVKDESNKTVPYYKLFSFADSSDYLLMFVGIVSAVGNGITKASTNIVMGEAIDAFTQNGNTKHVVHEVSKVITSITLFKIDVTKICKEFMKQSSLRVNENSDMECF